MSNLLEIKPYIHDFIEENLDSSFITKVYWSGEKRDVPDYPYCLLTVIAENKDKRTSFKLGDLKIPNSSGDSGTSGASGVEEYYERIITRYKTATITIGVYNAWIGDTSDTTDMDVAKEWAYSQIDLIEGLFEDYPENNIFSVQNVGSIRPLHEPMSGGYMYRFEFDLLIGYDEELTVQVPVGKKVNVDINKTYDHNTDGADNTISFEVDSTMSTVSGRITDKI